MTDAAPPADDREAGRANRAEALAALDQITANINAGQFVYGIGDVDGPSGECWDWMQSAPQMIYQLIKTGWVRGPVHILISYDRGGKEQP